jgi:hypothetical protein
MAHSIIDSDCGKFWLMKSFGILIGIIAVCCIVFVPTDSESQTPGLEGLGPKTKAAAFKYYIWGSVRNPGLHLLGPETDITELLSAAGGPSVEANLGKVDILHGIDRRLERINLQRKLNSGEVVALSPGDVVIVHRKFWHKVRESVIIVSSIATLLNLAILITRYSQL